MNVLGVQHSVQAYDPFLTRFEKYWDFDQVAKIDNDPREGFVEMSKKDGGKLQVMLAPIDHLDPRKGFLETALNNPASPIRSLFGDFTSTFGGAFQFMARETDRDGNLQSLEYASGSCNIGFGEWGVHAATFRVDAQHGAKGLVVRTDHELPQQLSALKPVVPDNLKSARELYTVFASVEGDKAAQAVQFVNGKFDELWQRSDLR